MRERTQQVDKRKYETPMWLFEKLNKVFGPFTLDACAEPETAKVDNFFIEEDDALSQEWDGIVFMNPPFGRTEKPCLPDCKKKRCMERGHHIDKEIPGIEHWVRKAYLESKKGATVVGVLPGSVGTKWFHDYVLKARYLIFIRGRVSYKFKGKFTGSPDFDTIIAVWKNSDVGTPEVLTMRAGK